MYWYYKASKKTWLTNARPIGLQYERFRLFKQTNEPKNTHRIHQMTVCIYAYSQIIVMITLFSAFVSFIIMCIAFPTLHFLFFFLLPKDTWLHTFTHSVVYLELTAEYFKRRPIIKMRVHKPLFRNEKETRCLRKRAK